MAIDLELIRSDNDSWTPERLKFAEDAIKAYTQLADDLANAGAGNGTWYLSTLTRGDVDTLQVRLQSGLGHDANAVEIDRYFLFDAKGKPSLRNELMVLGENLQKKGLADVINRTGVDLLTSGGGKLIEVHANLDVGGYAWLRKGVWPKGGSATLDAIVSRASGSNLISSELTKAWFAMPRSEQRAFVLTDAFKAYKPAFLGSEWKGTADLSRPEVRAAFTGVKQLASRTLPEVAADATANEIYRDATLRHQIGVRRYASGLADRVAKLLETADRDLTSQLRQRLARFKGEGRALDYTGQRWKALIKDMTDQRAEALAEASKLIRTDLAGFSVAEGSREVSILTAAIPIKLELATVAADQLRAILTSQPFQGRLLGDWFKKLKVDDGARLVQALQIGMVQGQPIDDLVRTVVGTRANAYADGILAITRRDANTIVRTAVNHVSNAARGYVWDANQDIIQAEIWTATLDGRTSASCRGRDGHGAPVGDNKLPDGVPPLSPPDVRPPGHMNCRSIMVAFLNGIGLVGRRPTVTDIRTRRQREIDFRAEAKRTGKSIQTIRAEWAAKNIGGVPAATTYQDFLMRQSVLFQNEVLGPTRAALFRNGGLKLDQFIDRAGNSLTLDELAKTQPEAFRRAGIDPAGF